MESYTREEAKTDTPSMPGLVTCYNVHLRKRHDGLITSEGLKPIFVST